MTCGPCTKYSDRDDIPRQYSRQRKGNFGIIEKTLPGGEMRKKSHVMQSIKRHVESSLHIYCCIREKKEESEKRTLLKKIKMLVGLLPEMQ